MNRGSTMSMRSGSPAFGLALAAMILGDGGEAQAQQTPGANPSQIAAKVERAALAITPVERYLAPLTLEPLRRVAVMAPAEGVLRTLAVPIGATVTEGQEIARLETGVALARHKIATANVREAQAEVTSLPTDRGRPMAEARLDAAKARAELAQMEIDACTLRAPFNGRVTAIDVAPGQYLTRGATILTIDDTTSLRVLLPVNREAATVGGPLRFTVEGAGVSGRVQAVLPLPDARATLRELASPLVAAWVVVDNPTGALEPGQRVQSPYLPNAPIAGVPAYAIKKDEEDRSIVQVIRAERVVDVPVKILGPLGPDRSQVSGTFRSSDALIQASSVPLRAGTFIRFNDAEPGRVVEGTPPPADRVGESAEIALPSGGNTPAGVAPIGAGGRPRPPTSPTRPATAPATKPSSGGVVPF